MAPRSLGVIGAGQLARMMAESASELGIELVVLAANPDDSACAVSTHVIVGEASDGERMGELARRVDAITLDHELVDLDVLECIRSRGVDVHPSVEAVRFAADKQHQRESFAAAGVAVPRFLVLEQWNESAYDDFVHTLTSPPVIKAARGGYDGRGVVLAASFDLARTLAESWCNDVVVIVEEKLELLGELAALIVTSATGERRSWPVVRTVQHDGMCSEVRFPCGFDETVINEATALANKVANVVCAVGVLAVEMFVTDRGVLVNEVATRPHNSGHWTIEGSVTSQFENHVRAVLGLPLGDTSHVAPAAVMVNLVGDSSPGDLAQALAVRGAHIHDYGKQWRPGRKLGHVTVIDDDQASAHVRAWEAAKAFATSATKESL
jgi:5-(carboxyamino)imidazole ribonucleotide synthase